MLLYLITNFQDAHNAILDYGVNSSLFAVYDGHGGSEVAKYCALHLPEFIKENAVYKSGDFEKVHNSFWPSNYISF